MYYHGIDMDKASKTQYGQMFSAVKQSAHLWGWKAVAPHMLPMNISMAKAVESQFTKSHRVVSVGISADDWKAFDPLSVNHQIVPVMQIATDCFGINANTPSYIAESITQVKLAISNFKSAIGTIQTFYQTHTGRTFRSLQPIIQYSGLSSGHWWTLAHASQNSIERYVYGDKAIEILKAGFGAQMNPNLIYLVTQFCGMDPDNIVKKISPFGAVNRGNICIVPATICLEQRTANDPNDFNPLFAVGHELGHAFGLTHTDAVPPEQRPTGWQNSIMQWGWNGLPVASFTQAEKDKLRTSPYLV